MTEGFVQAGDLLWTAETQQWEAADECDLNTPVGSLWGVARK